LNNLMVATR